MLVSRYSRLHSLKWHGDGDKVEIVKQLPAFKKLGPLWYTCDLTDCQELGSMKFEGLAPS